MRFVALGKEQNIIKGEQQQQQLPSEKYIIAEHKTQTNNGATEKKNEHRTQ